VHVDTSLTSISSLLQMCGRCTGHRRWLGLPDNKHKHW
jgi:hypothetical protein